MGTKKLEKLKLENGWTGLTPEKKARMKQLLDGISENWDKLHDEYKNKKLRSIVTKDLKEATHWRPLFDERHEGERVTVGKLYRLFRDIYDDETIIFDDNNTNTTVYMWHKGEWVILEGSWQWNDYFEQQEWNKLSEEEQYEIYKEGVGFYDDIGE